jgi:hypothetical protein
MWKAPEDHRHLLRKHRSRLEELERMFAVENGKSPSTDHGKR